MKKVFSILMVVMIATMMMSCGKDKTDGEAADNTLLMNGKTYQLESQYALGMDGRSYAFACTVDLDANGDPLYTIISDVEENTLNKTYDLSQPPVQDEIIFWSIHDSNWEFQIGPELPSGTLTISRDKDLFVYKVNGKTEDGQLLSFTISVPASEWDQHQ